MNKVDRYEKIIWVYKIPEIFFENSISKEKLKNLPVSAKQGLIFKLLETLSLYLMQDCLILLRHQRVLYTFTLGLKDWYLFIHLFEGALI